MPHSHSAITPAQGPPNPLAHLLGGAERQQPLPVDLPPEGHLAAELLAQLFDVHAEELRVEDIHPNHLYGGRAEIVVFDPVVDVETARQDPDLFLANHRTPLVLDEIHYAPELVASLKRRLDQDRRRGHEVAVALRLW
ncbi:MAG: hypothetical protein FJY95_08760 [Candidatus Handelsmanbacteria bacterium]|nr:hypothetical protein [Candidatus Handelsmanbacteria bacterium]